MQPKKQYFSGCLPLISCIHFIPARKQEVYGIFCRRSLLKMNRNLRQVGHFLAKLVP